MSGKKVRLLVVGISGNDMNDMREWWGFFRSGAEVVYCSNPDLALELLAPAHDFHFDATVIVAALPLTTVKFLTVRDSTRRRGLTFAVVSNDEAAGLPTDGSVIALPKGTIDVTSAFAAIVHELEKISVEGG